MNKIPFKKIGEIRTELKQLNGLNWYTKHAIAQELIKEAGWKENIFSGILAAVLMVLNGTTVEAAARKTNTRQKDIMMAMQDADTVNKAINIWKTPAENKPVTTPIKQPQQINTNPLTPTPMPTFSDIYTFIKSNEGYKTKAYRDPAGNLSIGIGFNLDRPVAKTLLKNMGISYKAVRQRQRSLNDSEIKYLFKHDVNVAINSAKQFVSNFNNLPYEAKIVLIDMAYNIGPNGLNMFQELKNALENFNFKQAAREMESSKWYSQVKSRGEKLVDIIESIPLRMSG